MDEQHFFRRQPLRESNKRLARRVRGELKLFDVTTHALRRFAWIKRYLFVWQGVAQNSGGRFRISVTNEENGMPWLIDDSLRENVGKCFWSHHPAGERVNTSRPCSSLVNGFGVQNKRAQFIHQLQTRKLTPSRLRAKIVNVADLCAESADVDRSLEYFF